MQTEQDKPETFLPTEKVHKEIMQAVRRLQNIQNTYIQAARELRQQYGINNRACGPSSFSLAVVIQEHFRTQNIELPIDASITKISYPQNGIYIMFGTEKEGFEWIDHAWVEGSSSLRFAYI
ncbi:hypothetical protein LRY65_01900 [Candidatus Woesebacteria bacterium]|nr:hypothetical protein [Candidatus Woesebacteria bacterium]MCD8507490.1 hypothetical protein [Candidatus Woesebacteria bacterium]MCD8526945.1 hypothetical protein [Candidatus Woesebacteria bacterium]MCD8545844.1 hypothetical protein [Candidatus Woesebacteria bacterium]